jgi:hypothetical protein
MKGLHFHRDLGDSCVHSSLRGTATSVLTNHPGLCDTERFPLGPTVIKVV